jgi:transcriptional regulator with XRE-family HTH domain
MDQPDWELRVTNAIAAQMRQWRGKRRLSAQVLADRTAALGMEVPRSTLADLENGRRTSVKVPELLVIARALDIGPADLLAAEDGTEISPGAFLSREGAAAWLGSLHCLACGGEPAAGFTCNTCGRAGA